MPKNKQIINKEQENKQYENLYDEQMVRKYIGKSKYLSLKDDQNITTLKFVDELDLQELQVYFCYNINFTRVPLRLTDLHFISCNLQKIAGLRQMLQLTKLSIYNNSTSIHLQELQYLTNLKYLNLDRCQLVDITPINLLINLQNLNLSRNNLYNINPLRNLKNLLELELVENNIVDISPLQDLVQIQRMTLSNNPIIHIQALRNFTELQALNLSQTFVQDLSPLQNHQLRTEYEIYNLKEPTEDQIQHSWNFLYIKYLEEMLIKYENTETQFKNRIQIFNKKITKPYKGAVKNQRRFSEKLIILFKQIEVDTTFDQ
ncbi:leucine-rich_repeat domain-containing protein [Hexamita inflata]|uniref:Leucine-rich repeat domain-containing protein n=1 Tax=Hexamita inflata TaxID=28002 RepID=A0AA86QX02_9EUKA|nr:leucine-rich repeat domain-containing protein [Hexamita inflata]